MLFLADLLRLRLLSSAWFGLEHHLFCKVDRCILSYVFSFKIVSKPQSPWTLWRPCHKNMSSLKSSSSSNNSAASSFRKKNVEFFSISFTWNHCLQMGNTKSPQQADQIVQHISCTCKIGYYKYLELNSECSYDWQCQQWCCGWLFQVYFVALFLDCVLLWCDAWMWYHICSKVCFGWESYLLNLTFTRENDHSLAVVKFSNFLLKFLTQGGFAGHFISRLWCKLGGFQSWVKFMVVEVAIAQACDTTCQQGAFMASNVSFYVTPYCW